MLKPMNTTMQLETMYLDAWQAMPVVLFETDTASDEEPLDPREWGGDSVVTGTGPTAVLAIAELL